MSKFKEAMDGEEDELCWSALINALVVKVMSNIGNIPETFYIIDKLKHNYFNELIKFLESEKGGSEEK
jgi:hypothetical protein